jgi:sarcosine oxidase/L-pipecolate oxidase
MWRWKDVEDERVGREVDGVYRGLITNDGSRGGKPGMILKEEIEKSS